MALEQPDLEFNKKRLFHFLTPKYDRFNRNLQDFLLRNQLSNIYNK